jgi:hypothetical protein
MHPDIATYHNAQTTGDQEICTLLHSLIEEALPTAESKVWHAHPVWFLNGNPIVGYSRLKEGMRLMFWSGADFDEPKLESRTGKFKDASITYTNAAQIEPTELKRWLEKSRSIQWDYKNLVKRKGVLEKLSANPAS